MGTLLRGVKREQVRRGQVVAAPGSIKAVKKFQAQIYVRVFGNILPEADVLIWVPKGPH